MVCYNNKYETTTDCINKIISKIFVSTKDYKVSLLSLLFTVWFGSHPEAWGNQGDSISCVENFAL